jgi:CD2 antigen cytoplasmic tail-binding protein 2
MDSSTAAAAFTRLTELADLLLNAGGELGIYSQRKEQLERFAKAVLPETDILAGDDGGDDMFGDDDDIIPKKSEGKDAAAAAEGGESTAMRAPAAAAAAGGSSTAANGAAAAAAAAGSAAQAEAGAAGDAAAAEAAVVDYSSWPVKELRRFLTERGVDSSSIVEKGELVNEVGPKGCVNLASSNQRLGRLVLCMLCVAVVS